MVPATPDKPTVLGLFVDEAQASAAVGRLLELGCAREGLSALMRSDELRRELVMRDDTESVEGAATGGVVGGALGALAFGLLSVSGIGVLGAGPLLAAAAGAGSTGVAGTLIGYLIGRGVPEEDAGLFAHHVEDGRIVVGAEVDAGQVDEIRRAMVAAGAERVTMADHAGESQAD